MASPEYDQIEQTLHALSLPKEVTSWDVELGSDSTDGFAAWIILVISDEVWNDKWLRDTGRGLRHQVSEAVRKSGVKSWPYLTLMTASDYRELRSEKSVS